MDGRFTHPNLLGEDLDKVNRVFKFENLFDQLVQVNLGVREDFSSEDGQVTYIFPNGPLAGGKIQQRVTIHNKYSDSEAAPAGKSALTAFLDSDYNWWKAVEMDVERYRHEKECCVEVVLQAIEQGNPGIRGKIEVVDVSTPVTRERYTGNWMGAMQARRPNSSMIKSLLQASPIYFICDCRFRYGRSVGRSRGRKYNCCPIQPQSDPGYV